jgi:hypothetical protein
MGIERERERVEDKIKKEGSFSFHFISFDGGWVG